MADPLEGAKAIIPGSRWVPLQVLGAGGGAVVYLCVSREQLLAFDNFEDRLRALAQENWGERRIDKSHQLAVPRMVESIAAMTLGRPALAAVKIPHEAASASHRLRREIEAMRRYVDPALIRLLDADVGDAPKWFACEYHPGGTLAAAASRERYRGNPLLVLENVLPLARGLAKVHLGGAVHRDVKPGNIFCAADGRLVLGDFGVVVPGDDATRLTAAADEPAHSRDWVPDWVRFGEEKEYTSEVDVFALAKVIYFLIAGENVMASQAPTALAALRERLHSKPGLEGTLRLLERCIVAHKGDCPIREGQELAAEICNILREQNERPRADLVFSSLLAPGGGQFEFSGPGGAGGGPREVLGFAGVPVRLARPARRFEAVARVFGNGVVSFALDGRPSAPRRFNTGGAAPPGVWTTPIELRLQEPLQAGWPTLTVYGDSGAGGMSGFLLYALD